MLVDECVNVGVSCRCEPHHAQGGDLQGKGQQRAWGLADPGEHLGAVTFYYHYSFPGSGVSSLEQQRPFRVPTVTSPAPQLS